MSYPNYQGYGVPQQNQQPMINPQTGQPMMVQQPMVMQNTGYVQQPMTMPNTGYVQQPYVQPMVQQPMVMPNTGYVQQPYVQPMVQQPMVMPTTGYVQTMPTVNQFGMAAVVDYSVSAKEIYNACKGFGTDEATLIRILGTKTVEQNLAIAQEFQKLYGKSLATTLASETSGHFKLLLKGLVTPIPELKADYLYEAFEGPGTKDKHLIDVIAQSFNAELMAVKQIYGSKYHGKKTNIKKKSGYNMNSGSTEALAMDVRDETSGNFEKTLLALLDCRRDESGLLNDGQARTDAQYLYDKGEGRLGTDDTAFITVITSRSNAQLQLIDKYYRETKKKHSLVQAIESETSGDFKDALIACVKQPATYWAERIHHAVAGVGTNDWVLIYVILFNRGLKAIGNAYQQLYSKSLESAISSDTSGDYRKLLLEVVKFRLQF